MSVFRRTFVRRARIVNYKRVLTIQDISCVGQCSMTVALPILSACGLETGVLPSAVLSTHTGGFKGFTVRDLTEDFPGINAHWQKEGIKFDAVYTGYLGSVVQVDYVKEIMTTSGKSNFLKIVDPAMGDNGKLYPAFGEDYVQAMKSLCAMADLVLPNITEAAFLTGTEFKQQYDKTYVDDLVGKLLAMGAKTVVMTGVSYRPGRTGVLVANAQGSQYYEHELLSQSYHGTGDVFASAFTGALLRGKPAFEAAQIAADYTVACIRATMGDKEHWYGVKFEPCLPVLQNRL